MGRGEKPGRPMPTRSGAPRPAAPTAESPAQRARRVQEILERLKAQYPQLRLPLVHRDPFQLLVATILSAQCTDVMVNRVTPVLFERYPTVQALATARARDVERIIKPTGF